MLPGVFGEVVEEYLQKMEQWIGSLAIVTGASAGIGKVTSEKLVKAGIIVVGIGRRIEILEEMANNLEGESGTFHPKQCDITKEEEVLELFQWIEETLGPISILINNAGTVKPTTLKNGDTEYWKETFDLNVLAACVCTKEALKSMKTHGIDGYIIHVNSVAGHFVPNVPLPEPMLNVYPASKHAVTAMTETLRKELIRVNSKIKVSSISPGLTMTEVYRDFSPEVMQSVAGIPMLQSEDVANGIMYMLSTPPPVHVTDLVIRPFGETI